MVRYFPARGKTRDQFRLGSVILRVSWGIDVAALRLGASCCWATTPIFTTLTRVVREALLVCALLGEVLQICGGEKQLGCSSFGLYVVTYLATTRRRLSKRSSCLVLF